METENTTSVVGAEKTKYNALTHGILKESISEYEQADFDLVHQGLVAEYEPTGMTEYLLIQMATTSIVKNSRINKAEVELFRNKLDPITHKQVGGMGYIDIMEPRYEMVSGYVPKISSETVDILANYSRYQTANENRFYKAISALRMIKNDRDSKINSVS